MASVLDQNTSVAEQPHDDDTALQELCDVVNTISQGLSSVRETIKDLREKQSGLDTKDGISLLSLKHHLLLSYLHSIVLVSSRRAAGASLTERKPPLQSFSAPDRGPRGNGAGDRVDKMIESRVILEKIKVLEGRMKYQIEKLVRVAEEAPATAQNVVNDPLAFRPNPQALMDQEPGSEDEEDTAEDARDRDDVYRPPKLAPMPYTEPRKDKDRSARAPVPSILSSLVHLDPSRPYVESTSGLGSTPTLMSKRARELQRMAEFEEENMTRLVMKKRDAKRRARDEADIALGGTGASSGRRGRGGGLEDEFADILRSSGRSRGGASGDGYEELRQRGRKESVLVRSRTRGDDGSDDSGDDGPKPRKRSRFEKAVKTAKKRASSKRR